MSKKKRLSKAKLARKLKSLAHILGIDIWGNLGPLTIWRDKNRKLCFARRYPRFDPRTPAQLRMRRLFKKALDEFQSLSKQDRALWEWAVKKARILMPANAFYIHCRITGFWTDYVTLCEATGAVLPLPSGVTPQSPPLTDEE